MDRYGLKISYRQQNKLYLNNGKERFVNVSALAGPGFQTMKSYRGAVFADFDNDGAIDVAVVALDDHLSLLMNQRVPGNHWILIKLVGTKSNYLGVGARVTVVADGTAQTRELKAGGSFASCNDPRAISDSGKQQ